MPIYLDYNATTPLDISVNETICHALSQTWANPSSSYLLGKKAKDVIEKAREQVASMVKCQKGEIIFTSGGTESNNMVIHSVIEKYLQKKPFLQESGNGKCHIIDDQNFKPHIITSNIEHDSIKLPLKFLTTNGRANVTTVPVSKVTGAIDVEDILSAIRPETCLITIILANNETGIIQPLKQLSLAVKNLRARNNACPIVLHTDAAQAFGKIDVDVNDLGVDYLTIVGHKFYGPRIGALYFKTGHTLIPMFYGGGQEKTYRPGTENTCMIAGLGKAAELVTLNLSLYQDHFKKTRDYLEKKLKKEFGDKITFNVKHDVPRLPNTSSVAFNFDNVSGFDILKEATEICASTGAACHSNDKPSSILLASGVSELFASKTLRLSIGRETSYTDIDKAVQIFKTTIEKLCQNNDMS